MNLFNKRVLCFAAVLLFAGSNVFAQTSTTTTEQQDKVKQLAAQDVSTFVSRDSYKLPWEPIPERDILFKKRVWRDIYANETENRIFAKDASDPESKTLASILIAGFLSDQLKAYDGATDDRFTKLLTKEEFIARMTPGKGNAGFNPEFVSKYRIKEDWLFLRDKNIMVVRILGIAPVREVTGPDGKVTDVPLFWIYYPDSRNYLAQYKPKDDNRNWDEVFEGRTFKNKIVKVSSPEGPVQYKKQ